MTTIRELPSYITAGNPRKDSQNALTPIIARGLSKHEFDDRNGRIYASDGGRCERSGALHATVKRKHTSSASLAAYAHMGNAVEDLVVGALASQDMVLFRQYHLPEVGLNLGGYVDAIIFHNGRLRVLEVKSTGTLPKEPKPLHNTQAAIYSAILGLPSVLYYFSRSVAAFSGELLTAQFDIAQFGTIQREAIWRVAYANAAIKMGVTPRIPLHLHGRGDCGYCPFIQMCWEGAEPPDDMNPEVTPRQHLELSQRASAMADKILDPAVVTDRRIGILKHLSKHGTQTAKRLLVNTDWSALVQHDTPELAASRELSAKLTD